MPYPTLSQRFVIPDLPTADELLPYLRQIDTNRWYSNFGPLVGAFEHDFMTAMAQAHGGKRGSNTCLTTTSGTHALSIGLRLMGIGPGKRVLVPAVTFPACPLAVENLGAEALLADIDPKAFVLTPEIAFQIVQKVKIDAVMPVALYGIPLPAQKWDDFIEKTGIPVIIDAAAAIESQKYPKKALVAHSLHALKPFGIGEGGLLVVPDQETKIRARKITNFGMEDRISYQSGENAKMSEYHAAVALVQLQRWPSIKARRKHVFETYLKALAPLDGQLEAHKKLEETVVSCLMVSIKNNDAQTFMQELIAQNVPAHRTYLPPLYRHPHFAKLTVVGAQGQQSKSENIVLKAKKMDGAEAMNAHVFGLPFHAFLPDEDIAHYVNIVARTLNA